MASIFDAKFSPNGLSIACCDSQGQVTFFGVPETKEFEKVCGYEKSVRFKYIFTGSTLSCFTVGSSVLYWVLFFYYDLSLVPRSSCVDLCMVCSETGNASEMFPVKCMHFNTRVKVIPE